LYVEAYDPPRTLASRLRLAACGDAKGTRLICVAFVVVMIFIRANLLICSRRSCTVDSTGWAGCGFRLEHREGTAQRI
jgi:hypothetical protein